MTIAIDRKTGAVVGQVCGRPGKSAFEERQTITHNAENDRLVTYVRLFTGAGYRSVPLETVELEEVSDR